MRWKEMKESQREWEIEKKERKKKEKKLKCSFKTGKEEKDFGKLKKLVGGRMNVRRLGIWSFLSLELVVPHAIENAVRPFDFNHKTLKT